MSDNNSNDNNNKVQQNKPAAKGNKSKNKKKDQKRNRREIKTPKGTIDTEPNEMALLRHLFGIIMNVFRNHGGEEIDTPVFELKKTLTEKYGEDSKLIYDLADQGGEDSALRYDLTVPFARYLGNRKNIKQMKRYQIGKVYRRDAPAIKSGRFREFWQCDFDIVGQYGDQRVPEAEVLSIICEILNALELKFVVKFNHRVLLDGIMAVCGVEEDKFRTICSSIDKLDKEPWNKVKEEMVKEKGLNEGIADKIGDYVNNRKGSPFDVLNTLKEDEKLLELESVKTTLKELDTLFTYLKAFGCYDNISFDLSLARGLDYYTGVIYEAVLLNSKVGSIAAGGRYDNLIGMFSSNQLPAVGFSVGIQRILSVLLKNKKQPTYNQTMVFVAAEEKVQEERLKLCAEFWKHNISAETLYRNASTNKQWKGAEKKGCMYWVCVKDDNVVEFMKIDERQPVVVKRSEIVEYIQNLTNQKEQ